MYFDNAKNSEEYLFKPGKHHPIQLVQGVPVARPRSHNDRHWGWSMGMETGNMNVDSSRSRTYGKLG